MLFFLYIGNNYDSIFVEKKEKYYWVINNPDSLADKTEIPEYLFDALYRFYKESKL
jgi:hypothetical protein